MRVIRSHIFPRNGFLLAAFAAWLHLMPGVHSACHEHEAHDPCHVQLVAADAHECVGCALLSALRHGISSGPTELAPAPSSLTARVALPVPVARSRVFSPTSARAPPTA